MLMPHVVTGRVWKFGDDINTDLIHPGFALHLPIDEVPQHCFSANRPGWVDEVRPGDVLVAGRNLGVGSARPIGTIFLKLGLRAVLADSFNGLGLRNCVNAGLPVLPCPGITGFVAEGDILETNWATGEVRNLTSGMSIEGAPLPQALQDLVEAGGVEAMLFEQGYLIEV
jgi:3-isopropylmalate/(R)-2-methylmalate dehydratase small subunit